MNTNDKITFADGPLAGKDIRAHYAADTLEGNFPGRYELATVMHRSPTDREFRVRKEYRYNARWVREATAD